MRADLRLSVTAVFTAAVLAITALPSTAFADEAPAAPSPIGVGRAVTDDTQRGTFSVTAWTDAPQAKVTKVAATVRQGDTVYATFPSLPERPLWQTGYGGTYLLPAESTLKLVEDGGTLPSLGTYAIDVTVTDSLGNTHTRTDAGTLDFRLRPQLTFGVGKPTWTDKNVRPQGTLIGIEPGSGDTVPLPGRTLTVAPVEPTPGSPVTAVTDGTGAFTGGPIPVTDTNGRFVATYAEDSDAVHGSVSEYRTVWEWVSHRVAVTAAADKRRALNGEAVTISGRMTDPNAGNAPLANQPVRVSLGYYVYGMPYGKTVYTDADGRYTARLIAASNLESGEAWQVTSPDPFLSFPERTGAIAIPWESRIDLVGGGLTADARVWVTGVFRSRYTTGSRNVGLAQYVQLEQSADGRTGWRKLASAQAYDTYGPNFSLSANSSGGYFRVRHLISDAYAESSSRVFRLVRTPTRIAAMNAGPEPVRKGAYVTATGTLQHYSSGAWRVFGNVPVALQFQAKGTTAWRQVATGRSATNGTIRLSAKAWSDGSWRIRYWGDSTHFHSPAPWADYIDVR